MKAQNMSFSEVKNYADRLVAKDILTVQGKDAMLKEKTKSNVDPIEFLASAFRIAQAYRVTKNFEIENRIAPEDSVLKNTWRMDLRPTLKLDTDYISPKRSTIGLTRTRTLNDLKEIGLISGPVFDSCKKGLEDQSIKDETDLLAEAFEMTMYYSNYDRIKERQISYISKLLDAGLISKQGKDALVQSYKPYEFKKQSEILSYSNRFRLVDLRNVQANPDIIYPIVFSVIRELLPEFKYKDLNVKLIEKPEHDLVEQRLVVSFVIEDRKYSHEFYYNFRKVVPDPTNPDSPHRVSQDFHKGVNKWLTDIASPYRLYMVNLPEEGEGPYGQNRMGLLLLKKGEAEVVSEDPYLLSHESFDNRLSHENIMKMVKEFSNEGIFSHLSKQEIDSALQVIQSSDINSIESMLLTFPKTIVAFDWETGNLENPYEDLTQQFGNASRGSFKPADIEDGFKKGWPPPDTKTISYGFTFNGKRYQSDLKFNGDWLEPEFFEMIKRSLKDSHVDGDFYYCISDGQVSGFIFLSKSQHSFIEQKYPDLLKQE